jgi:hypothetical protein
MGRLTAQMLFHHRAILHRYGFELLGQQDFALRQLG